MSAGAMVQAALAARLRDAGGLAGLAVFDAPPVRAGVPYAIVEEPVLARWGGTGIDGREGRIAVQLHDAGERPVRLRALAGAAEAVGEALAGDVGDGWRVAGLRLARSRIVRSGGGERWTASVEFSVRMYRVE